jgi:hypothetical protein
MDKSQLENRLRELQQEYQKGMALIEDTKAKMLRIEGAMIQLQELLKSNGKQGY